MTKSFAVNNLGCAHCGAKIEEAISKIEGIESAVLNFPLKKLNVNGEFNEDTLVKMNEIARSIEPDVEIVPAEHSHRHNGHNDCGHEHHHHEHCDCGHEHHHHHEHCDCGEEHSHGHSHSHEGEESIAHELLPLISGTALFAAAVISAHVLDVFPLSIGLYAAAYLILGADILLSAFKGIRK